MNLRKQPLGYVPNGISKKGEESSPSGHHPVRVTYYDFVGVNLGELEGDLSCTFFLRLTRSYVS